MSGLSAKGGKGSALTLFHGKKGGGETMKPSSFQTTIENQFDYICKRAMDDERKDYMKMLSRQSKREISFSDMGDYLVSQFSVVDSYSTDYQIFT